MSTGLLEVRGSLAVAQFWPNGGSDADTVALTLAAEEAPFRFRIAPDAEWRETHAFNGAVVSGAVKKSPISSKRKLTLRLNGVDAPELHCIATARVSKSKQTPEQRTLFRQYGGSYRQPFAESAILALVKRLGSGSMEQPCVARTRVDHPNEVFDCYGRLVSDLFVQTDSGELHVNHWLLEQGWAVPSLYDAMTEDEIGPIVDAANRAQAERLGIWGNLAGYVSDLDWRMRYRHLHVPPAPDDGSLLHPKFYRRLVTWAVNKRSNMGNGTYPEYLHDVNERCVRLEEHREKRLSAKALRLSDCVAVDGRFVLGANEILFKEKESELIGANGAKVETW